MAKRTKIIIFIFIMIIIFLISYTSRYDGINDLNRKTNVNGLKFLDREEDVKILIEKEYTFIGGMGGSFYESINKKTTIVFGGCSFIDFKQERYCILIRMLKHKSYQNVSIINMAYPIILSCKIN